MRTKFKGNPSKHQLGTQQFRDHEERCAFNTMKFAAIHFHDPRPAPLTHRTPQSRPQTTGQLTLKVHSAWS